MKTVHPSSIDAMIDRQARLWEVRNRLAEEGGAVARRELVHLDEGPWVTVSRQMGSGGLDVARRVGEGLGWQTYDREILARIAEHHDLRDRVLDRLDERIAGWIAETVNHLVTPASIPQAAFAKEVAEVVLALGRQGRAVLVGRGANWLLDARFGLRVRFVAPLPLRVERVARARDLTPVRAERVVHDADLATREYIRKLFGRDVDDPTGYDVTISTEFVDVDRAADIVRDALHRKLGDA
jgi:cytidylate kinase